jgi:hypothetical protein
MYRFSNGNYSQIYRCFDILLKLQILANEVIFIYCGSVYRTVEARLVVSERNNFSYLVTIPL